MGFGGLPGGRVAKSPGGARITGLVGPVPAARLAKVDDQPQRRIIPQDLIGLRVPADVDVAPDGACVAYTVSEVDFVHGEHNLQLHLAPTVATVAATPEAAAPPRPTRQLTFGLSQISAPAWSPDGRHLAFVTFRPQPHEDEEDDQREDGADKNQVFVLPSSGGEARRLTEAAEGVERFRWRPDSSGVYFIGHGPRPAAARTWRRRRKDAKDDGVVVYGEIPTWECWFQPLEGRPRRLFGGLRGLEDFDVSPDAATIAYSTNHTGLTADADRTEIILRDLATGDERRLTHGRGGAEVSPAFSSDGRFLLFHGWADPAVAFSGQRLFAVDLSAPESPPRPLLAELDRDLEEFVPLPGGRAAALIAWGFESRLVIVEIASGAAQIVPLEGKYLTRLAAASGAGRIALAAEDGATPPEIGFVDPTSGVFEPLTDLNPETLEWRRARRQRVAWKNEGLEHEGLLLLPAPEDRLAGEPPPVLVWIHGGPNWRATDALRTADAEAFAGEGWAVFLPQYRGTSGYSEPYQLAIKGDLGGADARDILAGLDHIGRLGLVDLGRAVVAGASYGGYLTNWLLAKTDRFRAGASLAGIFDLGQDFSTSEYASWELHYLGGPPWEKPDLYRERSPLTYAASIHAPLLILHGLEDDNTFFTNGKALYRALSTLGRTVEFVVYPREGHGISEPAHRLDQCHRILEWFGRHALGGATPRLVGREVKNGVVKLTLLGRQTRREYNGVRPPEGRTFFEVSVLLSAMENGPEFIRLLPAGPGSDLVLMDERGDLLRPIGVPVEVHGQSVLFNGAGVVEAWRGDDGRPPALPVTVVFDAPDEIATYRLRVLDLPPVLLQVPPPDEDDDERRPA